MIQFTTRKDGFRELRNKLLIGMISASLIGVLSVLLLLSTPIVQVDDSLVFTLVLMIPLMGFSTWRDMRRQKRTFESYRLTITENALIREQLNTPSITISRNRVKEIFRTASGVICIVGDSKLNAIGVPAQIENREELERILSAIRPIVSKSQWTPKTVLQLAAVFAVIVGCPIGLLTEDRVIITVSGIVLCAFLVYGFVLIRRSNHFDNRMKRMSYITFIPVLAILSYVVAEWVSSVSG